MRNRLLDSVEKPAADKEDIFSVHGYHGLLGMLAAALGRNIYHRAFKKLEEALLNAFAAHVAGYRRIVTFAGNLVDLVDEYYTALCMLHIVVGNLQQPCKQALYILAHIACLCKHRGVDYGERHIEYLGYSACYQSFAVPVGPTITMLLFSISTPSLSTGWSRRL